MSTNGGNGNKPKMIRMGHDLPPIAIDIIPDGATLIVEVVLGNMKWTLYMKRESVRELGEYLIQRAKA